MSKTEKFFTKYSYLILVITGIYLLIFHNFRSSYITDGTVTLEKDENDKEYTLNAEIEVDAERTGIFSDYIYYYTVKKVYWPNGGSMLFSDCGIQEDTYENCSDKNNELYTISVIDVDQPISSGETDY